MFTSKSSDIQVVMPEGMESVDPVKYHIFLGVGPMPDSGMSTTSKQAQGEQAVTASTGAPAQHPQGLAVTQATEAPTTGRTPTGGSGAECDPTCLCEVLGLMTNSLEHLQDRYLSTSMQQSKPPGRFWWTLMKWMSLMSTLYLRR